jgi:hypothetical protein
VGVLGDQLFHLNVLPKRVKGTVYRRVLVNDLRLTALETYAFSSKATHVVHACWGTTAFSPHTQAAPEPDVQ